VLLLDEPFSALDPVTRASLHDLLLVLWRELRPTVLMVTNDIEEAVVLADRIVVMRPHPDGCRKCCRSTCHVRVTGGVRPDEAKCAAGDQSFVAHRRAVGCRRWRVALGLTEGSSGRTLVRSLTARAVLADPMRYPECL
jgi:ABC-type nitrate/sulfonate/bicarbonate transport system ATPase subunit